MCVQLPRTAKSTADGYYFDTGEGGDGDGADPVRWIVMTSGGERDLNHSDEGAWNGSGWQAVGASTWQVLSGFARAPCL